MGPRSRMRAWAQLVTDSHAHSSRPLPDELAPAHMRDVPRRGLGRQQEADLRCWGLSRDRLGIQAHFRASHPCYLVGAPVKVRSIGYPGIRLNLGCPGRLRGSAVDGHAGPARPSSGFGGIDSRPPGARLGLVLGAKEHPAAGRLLACNADDYQARYLRDDFTCVGI